MTTEDVMLTCDVLVIGTEGAGACAAIAAADEGLDVLCVSKSVVGKSGATLTAARGRRRRQQGMSRGVRATGRQA